MSDLVGNPEDRFSRVAAHIMINMLYFDILYENVLCNVRRGNTSSIKFASLWKQAIQ